MSRDWRLYLRDVLTYSGYVLTFTEGLTFEDFLDDVRTQHAVIRDLEIVGEAVKQIPPDVLLSHPEVPWRRIARFRDRLAHGYFDLDLEIVWDVVRHKLPDVVQAVRSMLQVVEGGARP